MRAWATWLATMVMALGFLAQGTLALSTGAHAGPCKRFVAVSSTVAGDTVGDAAGQGQAQGCKVVADRLGESGLTAPAGTAPLSPPVMAEPVPRWMPEGLDRPPKSAVAKA